jgi:DNA polymerase III gamma/tau subunit
MIDYGYKHDEIIKLFAKSIKNNKICHAFLIYGSSGSGKTFLLNQIRNTILNMSSSYKKDSIDQCSDSFVVNTSSQGIITVDEIREIKRWFSLTAVKSKYKVVLINDVDKMNSTASNAFLKILEEPVGNGVILLSTSNISALLPTLKSRCVKIKLRKKTQEEFIDILCNMFDYIDENNLQSLYFACNGDINLAKYLIESKNANFNINLINTQNHDAILQYSSQLNLDDSNQLKLFAHLISHISSKITEAKINTKQELSDIFFSDIHKIQNIMASLHLLNKSHAKELIINILRKYICT